MKERQNVKNESIKPIVQSKISDKNKRPRLTHKKVYIGDE
jgi:hypothetical protein